jgi:hypothetical protein
MVRLLLIGQPIRFAQRRASWFAPFEAPERNPGTQQAFSNRIQRLTKWPTNPMETTDERSPCASAQRKTKMMGEDHRTKRSKFMAQKPGGEPKYKGVRREG